MAIPMGVVAGLAAISTAAQAAAEKKRAKEQKKENRYMLERQNELGLNMWNATGAQAQVGQLEAAGLNKALMYQGKGGGGQTAATPSGTPAEAENQSKTIGMALQTAMMAAQVKNIEADTKQKEAATEKTMGVDTAEAQTRIERLAQETQNSKLQGTLMEFDKELKAIELRINTNTEAAKTENPELVNRQLVQSIEKIVAETRGAIAEGTVKEETAQSIITQTRAAAIEQQLRIELQKGGIIKQGAETAQIKKATEKLSSEIASIYTNMRATNEGVNQRDAEIEIKKKVAELMKTDVEFRTGFGAEVERASRIIENSAGAISKLLPITKGKKEFPENKPDWMDEHDWKYYKGKNDYDKIDW